MSMIFLATGTCTLGFTKTDKDGNVVSSTPAQFTHDDTGSCVAIGELDPETMQPKPGEIHLYGDFDAAGYIAKALELLKPVRKANIPDFKSMIQRLWKVDHIDFCDYCRDFHDCRFCIVNEWKEEMENDS